MIKTDTPTVTLGAGAGTGASASVEGTDFSGMITYSSGTSQTSNSTVLTVNFSGTYQDTLYVVIQLASNHGASDFLGNTYVECSASGFSIKSPFTLGDDHPIKLNYVAL